LKNTWSLSAELFLYSEHDSLMISDVDGTLTKSDLLGLLNNMVGEGYVHEGYTDLVQNLSKTGCHIVWLTMRSLTLYDFSKKYIKSQTHVPGVLLTEPDQLLEAMKKEVTKNTLCPKTKMLMSIKKLFPPERNPFVGGLGNRENDAVAYALVGIPSKHIFLVDKESKVRSYGDSKMRTNYIEMSKNIK
jgi:phosphatidate phosphatase LPIN